MFCHHLGWLSTLKQGVSEVPHLGGGRVGGACDGIVIVLMLFNVETHGRLGTGQGGMPMMGFLFTLSLPFKT